MILVIGLGTCAPARAQVSVTAAAADGQTRKPLPFLYAYLSSTTDTARVKGASTNDKGRMVFTGVVPGTYRLTLSTIGYEELTPPVIIVADRDLDLGTYQLTPTAYQLEDVAVVAARSSLRVGLGKQTLNIGQDLLSDGSSVLEALESIPTVETTLRGDIRVRGSSDVVIFVNGKPSRKRGSDLANLPANLVSKIELITNPSAEYDAEGIAGIINIVMRTDRKLGVRLTSTAGIRVPTQGPGFRYQAGLNGNVNYNKLNISAGASALSSKSQNQNITDRLNTVPLTPIERYRHTGVKVGTWVALDANVTATYEIDTASSLEIGYNYQRWITDATASQRDVFDFFNDEVLDIATDNADDALQYEYAYTASYTKEWKPHDRELTLFFSHGIEKEDNVIRFNVDEVPISDTPLNLSISNDEEQERERINLLRAQYTMPLGGLPGQAIAGAQGTWVNYRTRQQLDYYNSDLQTGVNDFLIDQRLLAAYLLHEKDEGDLRWKIGLRAESYEHDGTQALGDTVIRDRYFNVFPSLQISSKLGERGRLAGSYSYRINRPVFYQINPYLSFQDPLNVRTGNSFLQPQFAHRAEASYQHQLDNGKIVATVFGHSISNTVQSIAEQQGDRVLLTYTNIGTNDRLGATVFYSTSPAPWLQLNNAAALYYETYGDRREELIAFASNLTWDSRLEQVLTLKKGWKLQLKEYYGAPSQGIQETQPYRFYVDLAIRKTSGDKKLAVSLVVTDLFRTRNILDTTVTPELELFRELIYQFQRVGLNVSYKLIQK